MEKGKKAQKAATKKTESSPPPVREVMDIASLAFYLGMGKSKIYGLIRQRKIPASRIGRQYRFSRSVIDQWLNEKLITNQREETQMPLFKPEMKPQGV